MRESGGETSPAGGEISLDGAVGVTVVDREEIPLSKVLIAV